MRVSANGVVFNDAGEVLLMLRDDIHIWSIPGGMLDPGETPDVGVVREVFEETGIEAEAVDLIGVQFWPLQPNGTLEFNYRCLARGGTLTPSLESPEVGYFPPNQLPSPLLPARQEQIEFALNFGTNSTVKWDAKRLSLRIHLGWLWLLFFVYPLKLLSRRLRGQPHQIPPEWKIEIIAILRDEMGNVLWTKAPHCDEWQLPSCAGQRMQAPWETAQHRLSKAIGHPIQLQKWCGFDVTDDTGPKCILLFEGQVSPESEPVFLETVGLKFFGQDNTPASCRAKHLEYLNRTSDRQPMNMDEQ